MPIAAGEFAGVGFRGDHVQPSDHLLVPLGGVGQLDVDPQRAALDDPLGAGGELGPHGRVEQEQPAPASPRSRPGSQLL